MKTEKAWVWKGLTPNSGNTSKVEQFQEQLRYDVGKSSTARFVDHEGAKAENNEDEADLGGLGCNIGVEYLLLVSPSGPFINILQ